jgi:hypothetical protein
LLFRQDFPGRSLAPVAETEWKLAYQLTSSKLCEHMRCFHTKKTFLEDVLGLGVDFTVNPMKKVIDYIAVL